LPAASRRAHCPDWEQINKHRLPTRPTKRNGNPHTAGFDGRSVELELVAPLRART
jgi:hypothetical protein